MSYKYICGIKKGLKTKEGVGVMLFHREKKKELIEEDETRDRLYQIIKTYCDIHKRIYGDEEEEEDYYLYFDYVMAYPPNSNPPSNEMPTLAPQSMI